MSGAVAWITGLPGSGKSTLARAIAACLREAGRECVILDGDEVRSALVPRPGYTEPERDAFYETLARLAALLARGGHLVVVAATAHRREYRDRARSLARPFIEVYLRTPVELCAERDPKGLYRAAAEGRLASLPGAGVEYDPPASPEIVAEGGQDSAAAARAAGAMLALT